MNILYIGSDKYWPLVGSLPNQYEVVRGSASTSAELLVKVNLIIHEDNDELIQNLTDMTIYGYKLILVLSNCQNSNERNEVYKKLAALKVADVLFDDIDSDYFSFKVNQLIGQCLYKGFLDEMNIMAVISDTDHRIIYANQAFIDETNYGIEAYGQKTNLLKSGKHSLMFYNNIQQTLDANLRWEGRFKNKRKDGSFFTEDAAIFPLKVGGNNYYCKTAVNSTGHEILVNEKQNSIQLATAIQKSLIAEDIYEERLIIRTHYQPLENVSGDIYNLYRLGDDLYCVFLADVVGHGVASALLSTSIIAIVNDLIKQDYMPDHLLEGLNNRVMSLFQSKDLSDATYFTAAYGVIDLKSNIFHYANCGHPAFYYLNNQKVEPLMKNNFPIGMFEDIAYEYESISYNKPSSIVVYTDGLVETGKDMVHGKAVFEKALYDYKDNNVNLKDYLLYKIINDSSTEVDDDITLITIDLLEGIK